MKHLPVFLTVADRRALVVGGGAQAASRVRHLRAAGARVHVVASVVKREIAALDAAGEIVLSRRAFRLSDLEGADLEGADLEGSDREGSDRDGSYPDNVAIVFAASGEAAEDARVARAAAESGLPVNVADRAELSTFIMPAIIDRDPVLVGVSTGGAAPVLAREVRARIERALPQGLGRLARFAESFRGAVMATVRGPGARRRFWESFFDGEIAADVLRGEEGRARARMLALVNRRPRGDGPQRDESSGVVHLVGAGPGDPELLTLAALRLLQRADVIVHDRLVGREILDLARRDAERVYVGKTPGDHTMSQDEINALLVTLARDGRQVVRLKGGDPFVFGRGGEEYEALTRAGIRVEVVPGITAAAGCAASAGMPLTHRDHASAVTFLSGHGRDGEPDHDWAALARGRQTLVFYMGVAAAGRIADRLMLHGMASGTPAAIIENGTRPDERVFAATLATLPAMVREQNITGPALIVIGQVAGQMAGRVARRSDAPASVGVATA